MATRSVILAEDGAKPKKEGFAGSAARWFGLLGVFAAASALALVPVSVDPEAVISNPGVAYYSAELRVFLIASAVLLVSATGLLVFDGRPLRFPVLIPALALLGVSALSTLFSARPAYSLYGDRGEGLLSIAAGVLLFFVLAQALTSRTRMRLLLVAATTTAVLVSVYGIAENYGFEPLSGWGNPPFSDLGRSSATIGNALTLSGYLTLMMGAATALWLGAATRLGRLVWLLALALIGACWIYAESRGALLGVSIALPLVLLAARRKMGTVRPLVVPVAVLAAAVAVAVAVSTAFGFSTLSLRVSAVLVAYLALVGIFAWLLERGRTRLAILLPVVVVLVGAVAVVALTPVSLSLTGLGMSRDATAGGDGDISMQTRLYAWRDTLPMILDRPLLGHGPDNYREPLRPYISEDLQDLITPAGGAERSLDRAHNHLLQLAATTGLLGLAAYLWLLVSFFRHAYKRGGWITAALSGAVLAYVIQLQTAFPSVATDVAFWGLLGVSVALMRLRGQDGGGELPVDEGRAEPPAAPDPGGSRRSRRRNKSSGYAELLVAGAIVIGLAAIALPTFAEQRERLARAEQLQLNIELLQSVQQYERFLETRGVPPEAGTYTSRNPIRRLNDRPLIRPSYDVTLTIETTPEGEFTMEAKKTVLAGTLRYSYDSATGSYTASPLPPLTQWIGSALRDLAT